MKIAAIGDLHMREDEAGAHRDLFAEIGREAETLVLCGDLTDLGKPREAELLVESLRSCALPVVAVLGNHDYESGCAGEIAAIVRGAGIHLLEGQSCIIEEVGFVGVKGFAGGFGSRMLGSFGEQVIKDFVGETMREATSLENAMRRLPAGRSMVVLHYAPIPDTLEGEPAEIMPFLGCSRLAETIDRFRASLVVHGHAHRGRYEGRTPGGTPVYNVAAQILKPNGKPYALFDL